MVYMGFWDMRQMAASEEYVTTTRNPKQA